MRPPRRRIDWYSYLMIVAITSFTVVVLCVWLWATAGSVD